MLFTSYKTRRLGNPKTSSHLRHIQAIWFLDTVFVHFETFFRQCFVRKLRFGSKPTSQVAWIEAIHWVPWLCAQTHKQTVIFGIKTLTTVKGISLTQSCKVHLCFPTTFVLFRSHPMGFRGKPTSDSNSPPLITPGKHVFKKLDFYWFPVDQSKKRTNTQANSQFRDLDPDYSQGNNGPILIFCRSPSVITENYIFE